MGETPHRDIQLLHDQLLKQNAEDIRKLQDEIYGVPHQIKELEKRVGELIQSNTLLNSSLQDFLRRIEDKYQTKEVCTMCSESLNKKMSDLEETSNERIQALETKFDKALIALVLGLIAVMGFLAKYGFDLVMKSLLKTGG